MQIIRLYGELGKKFGKEFTLDVSSVAEAINALSAILTGFKKYMNNNKYYTVYINDQCMNTTSFKMNISSPSNVIRIVPIISGRGNIGKIIVGAALIYFSAGIGLFASSALTGSIGSAALIASGVSSIGSSLLLGGITGLLSGSTQSSSAVGSREPTENRPSFQFDGPVNTTRQGNPVPVGYGRLLIGSQVISAGLFTQAI